MGKHSPSVKNDKQYEALRDQGYSKEKAARITNASQKAKKATGGHPVEAKGGRAGEYEDWKKPDLYKKAKEIGLAVNSRMKKDELVDALRNH